MYLKNTLVKIREEVRASNRESTVSWTGKFVQHIQYEKKDILMNLKKNGMHRDHKGEWSDIEKKGSFLINAKKELREKEKQRKRVNT